MSSIVLAVVFAIAFGAAAITIYMGRGWVANTEAETTQETEPETLDWMNPVDSSILLKEDALSSIDFLDRLLARFNGIAILKAQIAEADLRWSVGRLFLAMLLGGAATWSILGRMYWIPQVFSMAISAAVAAGPYFVILRRRKKKLLLFEEQFPDALDTLARALRAGNALAGAMQILSRETKAPVGSELRKAVDERNLGISWEQALGNLAKRIPIQEVAMFSAAVHLQSRTGGKLHEVLAKLAENMRESSALKGEIRAVAAHGKMTGAILTVMPIVISALMMMVNPNQMALLFTDPFGKTLLIAAACCLVAAHFVIRKLTDIKI